MYAKERASRRYDQFDLFSWFKLNAYIYSNSNSVHGHQQDAVDVVDSKAGARSDLRLQAPGIFLLTAMQLLLHGRLAQRRHLKFLLPQNTGWTRRVLL